MQEQFQRGHGMEVRTELDLQRMGIKYIEPATTDCSFKTFCAEERSSTEEKNF